MKKTLAILFIFYCLFPLCASANEETDTVLFHASFDNKVRMLECAKAARILANAHLLEAGSLLDELKIVKDLRLKERLKVLITSFIGSIPIPEPKAKVLCVVLALLADLVINEGFEKSEITYEIYIQLSHAASCLAECNYYNRLSLDAPDQTRYPIHLGLLYANFAIDTLTTADMLTVTLKQRSIFFENKGIGDHISHYINRIRHNLINDMIKHRKLTYDHLDDMETLLENYCEIVADADHKHEKKLIKKIERGLNQAFGELKIAQREWGIK